MTGYTRQSTADIIPTATVRAAPINAEYNAIRDAFAASGGHKHDGTTGEGEYVPLIADLDANNKVVVDTANNRVSVFTEVSGVAVEQLRFVDGAIVPVTDNDIDLGSNTLEFKNLYIDGSAFIDTLQVDQSATITADLTVNGNTTLGNSASDTVTITADVASHIIPSVDSTYDLGAASSEWRNLYIDGTANIDSLVADTADINGGTLDSVTIGATTPAAADFTTVDTTGNTAVGGNLGVTGATTLSSTLGITGNTTVGGTLGVTGLSTLATVDVNGGNIDATTIGGSNAAAGTFTNLTASGTVNLAGATVSNLGSVTTAAIGGGTINNTVIGGSTPAAITGTTITGTSLVGPVTGNVTGNITGNVTGNVTASSGASTFNNVTVNGTLDVTNTTIENVSNPTTAQQAATKAYVDTEITNLIGGAPAALDTLNELAAAINDDQNVYTTLTTSIATKLPKAGGTMTGAIAMGNNKITGLGTPTADTDATTKAYVDQIETDAEAQATAAAESATAAAASYDSFDDRYLGSKASDPTLDNDGDALITGSLYFDSANGVMKVYNGAEWVNASSSIEGIKSNLYYTATSGQTVFSGADDNTNTLVVDQVDLVNVYMNGVRLHEDDYTVSAAGNSVTLTTGAATGDLIYVEVFGNFAGQSGAEVAITGGTIDGTVIGGSTPAAGSFTTGSFTGNVSFGDNDKAIFGAGSDLQIYHDGVTSVIEETGSGDLRLKGTNIDFKSATNETYAYFQADGPSILYHNSSDKLATTSTGIDVTGTVTADGLTVDGDVLLNGGRDLHLVGSNPNAGTPFQYGEITLGDSASGQYINHAKILSNGNFANQASLEFHTSSNNSSPLRMKIADTGDISFYEDTGTTPKFFWDASAENLLIFNTAGTSFNNGGLQIGSGVGIGDYTLTSGFNVAGEYGYVQSTKIGSYFTDIALNPNGGKVGIGTATPAVNLHIEQSGTNPYLRITETGNTGIDFGQETNGNGLINLRDSAALRVFTSGTERMRIDSSGHAIIPAGVTLGTAAGVYNAANTLDDYEEGTWTATVRGVTTAGTATYGSRAATYTKVGNLVYVQCYINYSSFTGTGDMRVYGLPFLGESGSYETHPGSVHLQSISLPTDTVQVVARSQDGQAFIQLKVTKDNASEAIVQCDAAGQIEIGLTYRST